MSDNRDWRRNNKEHQRAIDRRKRIAKPDIYRAIERKRRALKYGVGHERYLDAAVFERDGWKCMICGKQINIKLKYPDPYSKSVDHIIPLSLGGVDAMCNVQSAHLRCNLVKSNKDIRNFKCLIH